MGDAGPRQFDYYNKAVYLDIYEEYPVTVGKAVRHLKINPSEELFSSQDIYPLSSCVVRGEKFPCPRESEKVLKQHYTADGWDKVLEI